jgi:hypothetical protein
LRKIVKTVGGTRFAGFPLAASPHGYFELIANRERCQ